MSSFYDPTCNEHTLILSEEESKHAIKSLRLVTGDNIKILNGKGLVLHATIVSTENKIVQFNVKTTIQNEWPRPALHVGISPLKQPDRFEWFVEKATELGVSSITPIICSRTEKYKLKPERLNRIMVSALKQSGNPFLPVLNPTQHLKDFLESNLSGRKLFGHCTLAHKVKLSSFDFVEDTTALFGPEGDFTNEEIELILANKGLGVDLGSLTLRTETAGIALCSYLQMIKK